ncbi:MAG TPA: hypothetical protein VGB70_10140 [Allosphingosinicella sp.]|jgi:hypothetical protein
MAKDADSRVTSEDYEQGRRDGLRLALAVLAAEEAKWAALLGESPSWRTNAIREVRYKTLGVAQKRVQTVLNRMTPKGGEEIDAELSAALDKLGL